jgi:acyl-CoA thioester hydrolase
MPDESHPKSSILLDVNIFDTDCYGVMWHGAYTKWMEMGRVQLLRARGIECNPPSPNDDGPFPYIYPVVEQQFKYLAPGRINDPLELVTKLEVQEPRLLFHQKAVNRNTGKVLMEALTVNVVLDGNWKMLRRLPPELKQALQTPMETTVSFG